MNGLEEIQQGLAKLKAGDFNTMNQEGQPDDSIIVTLTSSHYPETYRFRVKDLYGENEQLLDIETGGPL